MTVESSNNTSVTFISTPITTTPQLSHLISASDMNMSRDIWILPLPAQNISVPLPPGKYAVISCSTPMRDQFNYAFMLPLTVKAWTRVQYHTLVILTGSEEHWQESLSLRVVLRELYILGAYVVFIETSYEHTVMISQTVRLFACNIFNWQDPNRTYIVLSDADIWPMMAGAYDLVGETKMLSLNSECCGKLTRHNFTFRMLPMGNIAMAVQQWSDVMNIDQSQPNDAISVLQYFHKEFGDAVYRPTQKGENEGWFMDQIMISLRIEQWLTQHNINRSTIQYIGRDTGRDRIDRQSWSFSMALHRVVDCHVLEEAYRPGTWERLYALLRVMYAESVLELMSQYRHHFLITLPEYSYIKRIVQTSNIAEVK